VAYEVLELEKKKDPDLYPLMVIVSDGRPNVSLSGKDPLRETLEIADQVRQAGIASLFLDVRRIFCVWAWDPGSQPPWEANTIGWRTSDRSRS
jgi:Mg-chelatase subunit ChlD